MNFSPKAISDNYKALQWMKQQKISLLGSVTTIFSVIAILVIYYKILLPIKQNSDKIPELETKLNQISSIVSKYDNQVIIIDTLPGIKEIQKDLLFVKKKVRLIYIKLDIVKEIFPVLDQRFDDIDRASDEQTEELKRLLNSPGINIKRIQNE